MELTDTARHGGVREMYDEISPRFQDVATVENDFLDRSPEEQYRLNRFKLWALEHGGIVTLEKKNILEFGAGHGRMAIELPVFASYTGVDLSPNLVQIGKERLAMAGLADRAQLVACDCMDYQAPEEAFDVVCSLGMFPHIEHPEPVLRKMVTHLKPGGMLFIDADHSSPLYDQVRRLPPHAKLRGQVAGIAGRRLLRLSRLARQRPGQRSRADRLRGEVVRRLVVAERIVRPVVQQLLRVAVLPAHFEK